MISTHAGDESDGNIWGIEGMNIVFILVGLLLSLGLALALSHHHGVICCVVVSGLPFIGITGYVFALRQGKPKAHDTDLLETLLSGTGWTAPTQQPRNPLNTLSSHAGS